MQPQNTPGIFCKIRDIGIPGRGCTEYTPLNEFSIMSIIMTLMEIKIWETVNWRQTSLLTLCVEVLQHMGHCINFDPQIKLFWHILSFFHENIRIPGKKLNFGSASAMKQASQDGNSFKRLFSLFSEVYTSLSFDFWHGHFFQDHTLKGPYFAKNTRREFES